MANEYITAEDLKVMLEITGTKHDTAIGRAVESASRAIDRLTDRVFYPTAAETRYFSSQEPGTLVIDDLTALTSLTQDLDGDGTYELTWAATDYALYRATPDEPYIEIRTTPLGQYSFSRLENTIAVTGDWGWTAPPADIIMATAILATRLFKRKDAPFGIMGFGDLGQIRAITAIDPDVKSLIRPFRRIGTL